MQRQTTKLFVSIAACHFLSDCCSGVWPMFKYLAGLDLGRAGFIATVSLIVGNAIQPLFGLIVDRHGPRHLVLLSIACVSCAMLLGPLAVAGPRFSTDTWYGLMLALMMIVTIGSGMFHPAGTSAAGRISGNRKGVLISAFIACGMIGFSISHAIFNFAWQTLDRQTQWLLVPAAVIFLLAFAWCRPPAVEHLDTTGPGRLAQLSGVRGQLAILFLYQAITWGVFHAFVYLMPELTVLRGCPEWFVRGGGYFFWVAGTVVLMVPLGHLSDRVGARRLLIACTSLSIVLFYLILLLPQLPTWLLAVMFMLNGGLAGSTNPISVALGQRLAPGCVSLVSGILMGLAWALGSVTIWICGVMAGNPDIGITRALAIIGISLVVALALTFGLHARGRGAPDNVAAG